MSALSRKISGSLSKRSMLFSIFRFTGPTSRYLKYRDQSFSRTRRPSPSKRYKETKNSRVRPNSPNQNSIAHARALFFLGYERSEPVAALSVRRSTVRCLCTSAPSTGRTVSVGSHVSVNALRRLISVGIIGTHHLGIFSASAMSILTLTPRGQRRWLRACAGETQYPAG
jgi:hypothetical protein